jgi:hypothetical protein
LNSALEQPVVLIGAALLDRPLVDGASLRVTLFGDLSAERLDAPL